MLDQICRRGACSRLFWGAIGSWAWLLLAGSVEQAAGQLSRPDLPRFAGARALDGRATGEVHDDEGARVATDGHGNWIVVWQSNQDARGELGRDADILYARSLDDAHTWSAAAAVDPGAAADTADDLTPAIAADGKGTWMLVWSSNENLDGAIGTDRDLFFTRSNDAGRTWETPRPLNATAGSDWGDDEAPALATDGAGSWVVVWQSADTLGSTIGGDRDLLFAVSRDDGEEWSAPAPLNRNAPNDEGFDIDADIATDGKGVWIVVWTSNDTLGGRIGKDTDVLFARSSDGGATWDAPEPVAALALRDETTDGAPRLATDGVGNWICAWATGNNLGHTIGLDRDLISARSTDGGRTWLAPEPLNVNAADDVGDDTGVYLATDRKGVWVAAWQSWDSLGGSVGSDADIFLAFSSDIGMTWSRPLVADLRASSDHGDDAKPALAAAGQGTWVVVWESTDAAGGMGVDLDIFVATAHPRGKDGRRSGPENGPAKDAARGDGSAPRDDRGAVPEDDGEDAAPAARPPGS